MNSVEAGWLHMIARETQSRCFAETGERREAAIASLTDLVKGLGNCGANLLDIVTAGLAAQSLHLERARSILSSPSTSCLFCDTERAIELVKIELREPRINEDCALRLAKRAISKSDSLPDVRGQVIFRAHSRYIMGNALAMLGNFVDADIWVVEALALVATPLSNDGRLLREALSECAVMPSERTRQRLREECYVAHLVCLTETHSQWRGDEAEQIEKALRDNVGWRRRKDLLGHIYWLRARSKWAQRGRARVRASVQVNLEKSFHFFMDQGNVVDALYVLVDVGLLPWSSPTLDLPDLLARLPVDLDAAWHEELTALRTNPSRGSLLQLERRLRSTTSARPQLRAAA